MPTDTFSTTDIGLAIYLRTFEILTYTIEVINPHKRVFHFQPRAKAEEMAKTYAFHKERMKEEMFGFSSDSRFTGESNE